MFTLTTNKRPTHLGPYPLETLLRDENIILVETERKPASPRERSRPDKTLARAALGYQEIFAPLREREPVSQKAPVPDDLARRAKDIKGGAHFLDTSHVGICAMPNNAWLQGHAVDGHTHAIGLLVEFGRFAERDKLAAER